MSSAVFCELDSRPFDSFCGTHSIPCCALCHEVYPECKLEELSKAAAKMKADVQKYESCLDKLISKAKEVKESVPGWLTKQDGREKDMITEIQTLFSEIRRVVDDCEQQTINGVRETMSKHKLSARSVDKIVKVLSELKQEQVLAAELGHELESGSSEGAAVITSGVDVASENATSEESIAQRAKYLNERTTKLRQAISRSESLLSDYENVLPIDYETVINKGVLDSVQNILKDSCNIHRCEKHITISQLVKELDFSCGGTWSVMAFLNKSPKSDMIVASYDQYRLSLVTQSGETTKSVALKNSCQPYGICLMTDRIYVTDYSNQISVYQTSDLSHQTSFTVSGGCVGIGSVGDRLVVACPDDRCVRVLTTSGDVIAQSTYAFNRPWGVAVSPEADAVFVTDTNASQVVVLSPDLATHLRTIPCGGSNPVGVCVFGANIYVCNNGGDQVMELSRDGQRSRSVISVTGPIGICVNHARMCFMVSNANNDLITSYVGQL